MKVFITGASSGIGQGFAHKYARPGAVIGLCARSADKLAGVAREVEAQGARAFVYANDVSDGPAMVQAARDFVTAAEGVDVVIASAGIGVPNETRAGKAEPVAQLMRINVIGVTNTILPFVPSMLEQGSGTLAALSSLASFRGLPGRAAYSASKAAVRIFMDGLRLDLHDSGVHAMSLCPGFVRTPMTASLPDIPLAIERDAAVDMMAEAISQRVDTFVFPWQVATLSHIYAFAPEWLVQRLAPPARKPIESAPQP